MRIEIRCADCGGVWLVEGTAEGLRCPSCMKPLTAAGALPEPRAGKDPGLPAAVPHEPEEVVCPRCQLHFYPSGKRRGGARATPRQRILVVEDQEYFRRIAADALEGHQYEVLTAANTAEARVALARGDIDLIVLDLTLDGEQGRALLTELRPKPCPVLIFTAKDERELLGEGWEELKRLGADDVVVKGMQVAESLTKKVGRLLGRPEDEE